MRPFRVSTAALESRSRASAAADARFSRALSAALSGDSRFNRLSGEIFTGPEGGLSR